ncbi:uncharacterized protein LOC142319915 [Lycorma delicatula]|uniref:uncharacterized protein LOC142319915 n=1 Tax=Lycorma delicatula TaxID=130591 RepID=UPI003F512EBB
MFCISGNLSLLHTTFFPGLDLDLTDGEWELALINLTTYNSIPNDSLAPLLGFEQACLAENIWHMSSKPVAINNVNALRVECNLIRGSYTNGSEGHVLHEFTLSVPPGFKIIESPKNIIYLPVNTRNINEITLRFTDQNGKLINFRGETITVRLHLRRRLENGTNIQ